MENIPQDSKGQRKLKTYGNGQPRKLDNPDTPSRLITKPSYLCNTANCQQIVSASNSKYSNEYCQMNERKKANQADRIKLLPIARLANIRHHQNELPEPKDVKHDLLTLLHCLWRCFWHSLQLKHTSDTLGDAVHGSCTLLTSRWSCIMLKSPCCHPDSPDQSNGSGIMTRYHQPLPGMTAARM